MKPGLVVLSLVGTMLLVCPQAKAQTLDQQTRCAAQARVAFTEIETQRRPEQLKWGNKDISSTFSSYLNQRLNRCFVLIERTYTSLVGKFATEAEFTDAISRHGYAFYSDRDGAFFACDLSPPGKARVVCKTRDDFEAFVAQYEE
jgi:hypothetical protein